MSATKYHINSKGEAKVCHATTRACRFNDDQHFDNLHEANKYIEEKLTQENSGLTSSLSKKPKSSAATDQARSEKFVKDIHNILSNNKNDYSVKSLTAIGQVVEKELKERVSFDIDGSLDDEQFAEIQRTTHQLFSEITQTGGKLKNRMFGTLSDKLNNAVSVIPDNIKNRLAQTSILAKTIRKDATDRDGMHQGNARFEATVVSQGVELSDFKKSLVENVPDGGVYTEGFISESEFNDKYFGTRAYVKNEGSDKYGVVWIGKPLSNKHTGKKLSDTVDVYIGGTSRKTTIQQPVYEVKDSYTLTGSVISAKKQWNEDSMNSVLLHEYTHLVQQYDYTGAEDQLFNELRETDKPHFDDSLDVEVYDGFPDEYMGLYNGREVLTRATEGVFYPAAYSSRYLYGEHAGKNAEKVRQWAVGYWLNRDNGFKSTEDNKASSE